MPRNPLIRILLGAIVLASLWLRLWGISWGLPNKDRFTTLYVDEYTTFWILSHMNPSHGDFNPRYGHNPTFFYYQVGASLFIASKLGIAPLRNEKDYYLVHPDQYGKLYLVGRLLCVAYGVAATLVFYFLGKRLSGQEMGGLLSSLFYALIPISAISSHVIDVGVPVTFWLALSFWGFLEGFKARGGRWIYLSAIASGLSFSTKYTSAPIILVLAYMVWKSTRSVKTVFLSLVTAGIAYAAGTPYIFIDATHMLKGLFAMANAATGLDFSPSLYAIAYPFALFGYLVGLPLCLMALIGLYLQARDRNPASIAAFLFLIPYLGLLCWSPLHMARYLNETLPFLLPFATIPLIHLFQSERTVWRWSAVLLMLACVSRAPYTYAIDHTLATDPDPRDLASDWVKAHIPSGRRVGLEREATFMMPAQIYMDYWRGQRYPIDVVPLPHYTYSLWGEDTNHWNPQAPDYWIETNVLFSDVTKNSAQKDRFAEFVRGMRQDYVPQIVFKRDVRCGPLHYETPALAGHDWKLFLPEITIYAHR